MALDPFALDRDIARGAKAARRFLRALRRDLPSAEEDHPLAPVRWVSGKTTFDEVSSMPEGDPLREPSRRWILYLALVRIGREPLLGAARTWHAPHRIPEPEPLIATPRDLIRRILRERVLAKRRAWIAALAKVSAEVVSASKLRDEALAEIASRMGVEDPWSMWLPVTRGRIQELLRDFLDRTDAMASQLLKGEVAELFEMALGREVRGSWPAKADRFLGELFGGTELVRHLRLETGAMPEMLGASSLARALARFGKAYAEAAAPREAPFVLAHDPVELHPLRRGALFGSLLADPVFLRRALGSSRDEARDSSRIVARSLLFTLRLEAARALVFDARTSPAVVEETSSRATMTPWPRALSHVLPRTSPQAGVRFLAALLAMRDRDELVHRFDEDWFRNPHALRHLREEDGTLGRNVVKPEALDEAVPRLVSRLEEAVA